MDRPSAALEATNRDSSPRYDVDLSPMRLGQPRHGVVPCDWAGQGVGGLADLGQIDAEERGCKPGYIDSSGCEVIFVYWPARDAGVLRYAR